MSITSFRFVLFLLGVLFLYYLLPQRRRWWILLLASLGFYFCLCAKGLVCVFITSGTAYWTAMLIEKNIARRKIFLKENINVLTKDQKNAYKKRVAVKNKTLLFLFVALNLLLLFSTKYWLNGVNGFVVPLGISFYTLGIIGYITEVYWENIHAENNYFKVLLFVCFFPQIIQGPISDFEQLNTEISTEHHLSWDNLFQGITRIIWGYFKKMCIADALAPCTEHAFLNSQSYSGLAVVITAVLFMMQMYADFSGYMDIMCGFSKMLGISLTENFNRPFYSKSVSEFWRRWHMTLGAWLRKYIYYPVVANQNWTTLSTNKTLDSKIPASFAVFAVWVVTGLWHNWTLSYLTWGLLNGATIIISIWTEHVCQRFRSVRVFSSNARAANLVRMLRTTLLISAFEIIAAFDTLQEGFSFLIGTFRGFSLNVGALFPYMFTIGGTRQLILAVAFVGLLAIFIDSFCKEHHVQVIHNKGSAYLLRVALSSVALICILSFGIESSWDAVGFMYANF